MRYILSGEIKKKSTMFWNIRKHFAFFPKHITLRKAINTAACILEMMLKRSFLYSHPLYLRIDACPYCNLKCEGCIRSLGNISGGHSNKSKPVIMKYDVFKDAIKDFLPYLLKVNLYDHGEPLLNKDIYKMILYLSNNNVSTCISTHFSFNFSNKTIENILDCGLEHLIVAVDGTTQESYSQYRKGGDLYQVLNNIKRLLSMKSKKGKSPLKVEIQFIEFEHNKKEKKEIYKLAKELGVWRLSIIQGSSIYGWKDNRFKGTEEERRKRGCYQLWTATKINSLGELCICDFGEDHGLSTIGPAKNYLSMKLRNHFTLIQLRKSFRDASIALNGLCKQCDKYKR